MRLLSAILAFAVLLGLACAFDPNMTICEGDLGMHMGHLTGHAPASTWDWAIRVVKLNTTSGDASVLYDMNGSKFMVPASNNKVLSTSAAFLLFDPSASFSTNFFFNPTSSDLCVYPQGDMAFNSSTLSSTITTIATNLKAQGVAALNSLSIDTSFFPNNEGFPGEWEWGDLPWYYGARPSAAVVDANAFLITVNAGANVGSGAVLGSLPSYPQVINEATTGSKDSVSTLDASYRLGSDAIFITGSIPLGASPESLHVAAPSPVEFLANKAADLLKAQGITVKQINLSGKCDQKLATAWSVSSGQSITAMMNYTLLTSDNLYAEEFLRHVGREYFARNPSLSPPADALSMGLVAVKALLTNMGVNETTYYQHDGSGLSRFNLVTAEALVQTFSQWLTPKYVAKGMVYRSMLPVGGVSGTLKSRFTDIPGMIHAKTGSMTGINTLSGYADNRHYPSDIRIVFSVMVNGGASPAAEVRSVIDKVVSHFTVVAPCMPMPMDMGNKGFIWGMFGTSIVVMLGLFGCAFYVWRDSIFGKRTGYSNV